MDNTIIQMFPGESRSFWEQTASLGDAIQEIRFRIDRPIVIHCGGKELFLDESGGLLQKPVNCVRATEQEIRGIVKHICSYSRYAYEDELKQGFLTVKGGHRVGVSGQAVQENQGELKTFRNITFLNIRIAHEIKGAADGVIPGLYCDQVFKNTLILSPPGCGKTTLLRDIVRQISDGNRYGPGLKVGLVDERGEIAGCLGGRPQKDVGMRTDVLDGCPNALGMMMVLRTTSPEVIAIDELGSRPELEALRSAAACGCKIVATAHGNTMADVSGRLEGTKGEMAGLFEKIILLGKENGRCIVKKTFAAIGI